MFPKLALGLACFVVSKTSPALVESQATPLFRVLTRLLSPTLPLSCIDCFMPFIEEGRLWFSMYLCIVSKDEN